MTILFFLIVLTCFALGVGASGLCSQVIDEYARLMERVVHQNGFASLEEQVRFFNLTTIVESEAFAFVKTNLPGDVPLERQLLDLIMDGRATSSITHFRYSWELIRTLLELRVRFATKVDEQAWMMNQRIFNDVAVVRMDQKIRLGLVESSAEALPWEIMAALGTSSPEKALQSFRTLKTLRTVYLKKAAAVFQSLFHGKDPLGLMFFTNSKPMQAGMTAFEIVEEKVRQIVEIDKIVPMSGFHEQVRTTIVGYLQLVLWALLEDCAKDEETVRLSELEQTVTRCLGCTVDDLLVRKA